VQLRSECPASFAERAQVPAPAPERAGVQAGEHLLRPPDGSWHLAS